MAITGLTNHYYVDALRKGTKSILMSVVPDVAAKQPVQLALFERAIVCQGHKYLSYDGELDCYLEAGHTGDHYDSSADIYWRER